MLDRVNDLRCRRRRIALLAAAAVGLAGCGATESDAERAADRHAETAGTVMLRGFDPVPARDAAWRVAGHVNGTTIEALRADGTTWNGTIVLRITVDRSTAWTEDSSVRCYEYDLRHRIDDYRPHHRDCPKTPPLVLTQPPSPPPLTADALARWRRALAGLAPSERQDPAAVRRATGRVFGPPAVVGAARIPTGVEVGVRSGDECVTAVLPPTGAPRLGPSAHGTDCRGG